MAAARTNSRGMTFVSHGLYVGNKQSFKQPLDVLSAHNVGLIVSVAGGGRQRWDVPHLTINISDKNNESLLPYFSHILQAISMAQCGRLHHKQLRKIQTTINTMKHARRPDQLEIEPMDQAVIPLPDNPACNVLVHCMGGFSRSVAVVLACMIAAGMTQDQAFATMKAANSKAQPRPIFMADLARWAQHVHDEQPIEQ